MLSYTIIFYHILSYTIIYYHILSYIYIHICMIVYMYVYIYICKYICTSYFHIQILPKSQGFAHSQPGEDIVHDEATGSGRRGRPRGPREEVLPALPWINNGKIQTFSVTHWFHRQISRTPIQWLWRDLDFWCYFCEVGRPSGTAMTCNSWWVKDGKRLNKSERHWNVKFTLLTLDSSVFQ